MRYLLDTNVVSALRVRGRNRPVEGWARSVPLADQFVSVFTIAEIERSVKHALAMPATLKPTAPVPSEPSR